MKLAAQQSPASPGAKAAKPARSQPAGPSNSELEALIAAARFVPPSSGELADLKSQLAASLAALNAYLDADRANAQAWRQFLNSDELNRELSALTPRVAVLRDALAQYSSIQNGLEQSPFSNARAWLRLYTNRLAAATDPQARAKFDQQLQAVREALKDYAQKPSPEQLDKLSRASAALQQSGQGAELVPALRRRFSQPNVYFQVGSQLVTAGITRPVDDVAPLSDNILGTQISGTGHTIGRVEGRLVENPKQAEIKTVLTGTTRSKTIGRNGPALIYSHGTTQIAGEKTIILDAIGLHDLPATGQGTSLNVITGVASTKQGLVDKIVKKAAWKRIPSQKSAADRIAGEHAGWRVVARMNNEASPMLTQANTAFAEKFNRPLVLFDQFPRLFQFSTTPDYLFLKVTQSADDRFGAPTPPPEVPAGAIMTLRIHESMLNNILAGVLAGRTVVQHDLERAAMEYFGRIPDELEPDEEKEPWSLSFAAPDPITIRIDDNQAVIIVRGDAYTKGNRRFDGMYITARYQIQPSNRGFKAVRLGELQMFPPGYVPGGGQKLATRQIILRSMLSKRFDKILKPEVYSEGMKLPGRWAEFGPLIANHTQVDNGWALVTWQEDRQAGQKTAVASDP